MSNGTPNRTRSDRVASVVLPPGQFARLFIFLRRGDTLLRLGLCLIAAMMVWGITRAWAPPFSYRTGYSPSRDIVARVEFSKPDPEKTKTLQKQRRSETVCFYQHDEKPLAELQQALKGKIFQIIGAESAESYEKMDKEVWREFLPEAAKTEPSNEELAFKAFQETFKKDENLAEFEKAISRALADFAKDGLLENLEHDIEQGSQTTILVHRVGDESFTHRVEVKDVRLGEAVSGLEARLATELKAAKFYEDRIEETAKYLTTWFKTRLPITLRFNAIASRKAADEAVAKMEPATIDFQPGQSTLAKGGRPLSQEDIQLLHLEHVAILQAMTLSQKTFYSLANFGMYASMFSLCGFYVYFRQRQILDELYRFSTLLAMAVIALGLCVFAAGDQWRMEIIPLALFGLTVAIAYQQELAVLLTTVLALVLSISMGLGLAEFVILVSGSAASILLLGRIRSRTKLIYVGLSAGLAALLTTIGVGLLTDQTFGGMYVAAIPTAIEIGQDAPSAFPSALFAGAIWYGFCTLMASVLMTGLLPFIEKIFDVQTDISLLELGDVAHPLLQELVRRAPGTYNHSINVASIGEAAAEAIGANGLLVRVGAYFHDIGKMLKPGYFIENQGKDANRHDSLLPAMSTLVIIAHVKDGADLARNHHLPRSMINFIEQHHGTTLVEYFYRQAELQNEQDPDGEKVDETNFRYPGPKPQTKEAGVLMLADAVESASRTLVDPTPARIESLVHEMAMKRLLDGQFDNCGLTLKELHVIEDRLIKSLTAVYHGRVKYPDQQTA